VGFLKQRLRAFYFAIEGIKTFFRESPHAKIHGLAALLVIALGAYLECTIHEWLALIVSIALVLGMEALNSAIEYTVDLISPEQHPLAKKAKDVAAAAVLICALFALVIGIIIFVPKIIHAF